MLGASDTFDRYTIEGLIGEGGMGRVYRAYDPKLHRRVALKVLNVTPRAAPQDHASEGAARMLREARAAAALDHPNAVAIFDVGEVDGMPFIAMELVHGRSLRAFIGAPGISWDRRLRWLADVARALDAAHRRGLVHRDIKPENVMVRDDDVVKVLDFGIARRPDAPVDPTGATQDMGIDAITGKGVIVGTPHYMSPEQMRGDALDGRSDQFAWGVLAYELLSGRTPWKRSDDSLASVAELLTRDPAPLDLETLPPIVEQAVRRALGRSRDDRFPTMGALLAVLEPFVAGSSRDLLVASNVAPPAPDSATTEMASSTPTPSPSPDRARRRRIGLAAAIVGAGLVVGVGAGALFLRRPPPAASPSAQAAPRPTAVTDLPDPPTKSPEALAAFRSAMQAYRDGLGAIDARFRRATELDPNLAAAHLRIAYATFQTSPTDSRAAFAKATELRTSLSERDQTLLRALEPWIVWQPPSPAERQRRLDEAVAKYPLDAELWYFRGMSSGDEWLDAELLRPLERAVAIDPKFARAWWQLGQQRAYMGDVARAREDLGKCLDVTSAATSCLWNRIAIDEIEGRCEAVEADARRWTAVDPKDPLGYATLAGALYARGRPLPSVDEILRKEEAATPPDERAREAERNAVRRAMVRGDFAVADKRAQALDAMLDGAAGESEHQPQARAIVQALLESGRSKDAARYAKTYLERREAWAPDSFSEDFAVANDVVILMLTAMRAGGSIDAATFERRRQAWFDEWAKRLPPKGRGYVWIHGWAATTSTKDDAARALAALGDTPVPAFTPKTLAPAVVGHTYLLAGRVDEALPLLDRAAASCVALDLPWLHTRAQLWLGQAREAKGDAAGACSAYATVVDRWGRATPKSVTADEARARMKTLRCK